VLLPDRTAADRRADLDRVFSDGAAFRRWYEDAVVRVYGYVLVRCGGDVPLAEELTQQTLIQAVRRRETFDGRSDAITWLCSIARNRLVDHHRQLDREERRHLRLIVREIEAERASADPHGAVDEREAVLAALRELPAMQRTVLAMVYLDGMSVREAARAVGRSESATESLLGRARVRFREVYGDRSDG
jgi:RNA polymerase sigma-70 factor (ECF subfamily)